MIEHEKVPNLNFQVKGIHTYIILQKKKSVSGNPVLKRSISRYECKICTVQVTENGKKRREHTVECKCRHGLNKNSSEIK
jgi:hypothetical protein